MSRFRSLLAAAALTAATANVGTIGHERVDVSRYSPAPRPTKAKRPTKAQKKAARKARQQSQRRQR